MTTRHLPFPPVGMTTIDGDFIPYNNPVIAFMFRYGNYIFRCPAEYIGYLATQNAIKRLKLPEAFIEFYTINLLDRC